MALEAAKPPPIGHEYLELRAELGTALFALAALAGETRAPPLRVLNLQLLRAILHEPFLFVALGEAQSGRSSLFNALFGRDFCRVDAPPETAGQVAVFKYGEPARDVPVSDGQVDCCRPLPFLRDFHLAELSGASVLAAGDAQAQAVAEKLFPRADLILFVLSAVDPWAAGAWRLFELLEQKKWLGNAVIVLQQADLREKREVAAIVEHLRQRALPIFAVSAKKAFLAKTSGLDSARLWTDSGFADFEKFLNQSIIGSEEKRAKLRGVSQTAQGILQEIGESVRRAERESAADRERLGQWQTGAAQLKARSQRHIGEFLDGVEKAFIRCQEQRELSLRRRLRFWPLLWGSLGLGRPWGREFSQQTQAALRESLTDEFRDGLDQLEQEFTPSWTQPHDGLLSQFRPEARACLPLDADGPVFTEPRMQLFERLELTLAERLADDALQRRLQGLTVAGAGAAWLLPAGAAALGSTVLLTIPSLPHRVLFGIAGLLAVLLAVIGTVRVFGKRKKILAAYREAMSAKRRELLEIIGALTTQTVEQFCLELTEYCQPLDVFCATREARGRPLLERVVALERAFEKMALERR